MSNFKQLLKSLPPIRQILRQHNIQPSRKLGQNFLLDSDIPEQIMHTCGDLTNKTVLEIGPGVGSLTRQLLASNAAKVIAIEFDAKCYDFLQKLVPLAEGRFELLHADALKTKLNTLVESPVNIIANLPYNIGTKLLLNWLAELPLVESITVMLQKEVAERLAAQAGSKAYGSLAIITQWLCEVMINFEVGPENFMPPPKVTSAVLTLQPRPKPLYDCSQENLEKVTRAAFNQRRKMIKSSLKTIFTNTEAALLEAGITPSLRPEEVTIEQFCKLANVLEADYMRNLEREV